MIRRGIKSSVSRRTFFVPKTGALRGGFVTEPRQTPRKSVFWSKWNGGKYEKINKYFGKRL